MNYLGRMKWAAGPAASVVLRYSLAFVSVAIATGLAEIFLHFNLPQTFAAFALSAVAITFWYSGTAPGILCAVLSSLVRGYFFEPRPNNESRLLWDLVFLVFALLMTRLTHTRSELEVRVAQRTEELTQSNASLRREIAERSHAEYLTSQVFVSSPDAVAVIGTDYRYQRVNPVYEVNWGKPIDQIVGMHVADLWGKEVFERRNKPFLDICFAGSNTSFADWFDNARGRRFLALTYSPLRSDSQQVEAALVISRDLTELTLASEALRQTQSDLAHASRMTAMGELTASLAHEVNQPITAAITGASTCVRWLQREVPDLAEAREAALGVVRNAKRAADIINRIRSISKKGASNRQPIDINEVIREIIALLSNEANRYSISIHPGLDADLPTVTADAVQVQQVMMNLIMNSIDALKDVDRAREIVIRSQIAEDDQLMVTVSDTGVGLSPQLTDKIFDAFFTTKDHGIGMGLRISRSIIESHGGRLWADANQPHGARFSFTLPTQVEAHTNV
jgi:PAS domain S-box-containing protein